MGTLLGCNDTAGDPRNVKSTIQQIQPTNILNYGNGVYHFNSTRADFGNELSSFRAEHAKDLGVVSIAPEVDGYGYFVVTRQKTDANTVPK
jgi:hypothetical protein